jgi:hypothetical protein
VEVIVIESAHDTEHNGGKKWAIRPRTSQNDFDDSLDARTLNLIWVKVRSEVGELDETADGTSHLIGGSNLCPASHASAKLNCGTKTPRSMH